jgi:hypothetical protein
MYISDHGFTVSTERAAVTKALTEHVLDRFATGTVGAGTTTATVQKAS